MRGINEPGLAHGTRMRSGFSTDEATVSSQDEGGWWEWEWEREEENVPIFKYLEETKD